jgi:hypothetical protein
MRKHIIAIGLCVIAFAAPAGAGNLPDPVITPGSANPALTPELLCSATFSPRALRIGVSPALGDRIFVAYSMAPKVSPCPCEIDHLIPLALGGSNEAANLWPQSITTWPWNTKAKRQLEKALRAEVCSGRTNLLAAQDQIATNWIAAYQVRFGYPPPPAPPKKRHRR